RLLENPIHYRDARTHGMIERSSQWIDQERLYERTGNQLMEINTAFQLLSLKEQRPDLL
ncbi:MAG: rhamnulokinase, partial [Erysipelotrichaceae bacterium]|nr:rhamnulokinase [Erysipelotrichaceae bacterium]